jgi:hypothetical protein
MKEAAEKRVTWTDIDEGTFIRFSQYAYTTSYDEAEPQRRELKEASLDGNEFAKVEAENDAVHSDDSIAKLQTAPMRKKSRRAFESNPYSYHRKDHLWDAFKELHSRQPSEVQGRVNSPGEDYTEVFLCHARAYVFADRYGIDDLQSLALHKLRLALTGFELYPDASNDIIELVQYSFEKTVDKGKFPDALRSLICFYAGCKLEDLWKSARFRSLLQTVPDFPEGLISVLLNRLD